ncbi:glycosyltransferase, DXD sugar-binding motif protein [Artemisia annua]|uniref:Glycosyltransferase, DXD sugar-binding motif protein n=1 Tax=Artemisia annua TaxID=35608 RepID=A0A2U1Q7G7_ARTAN|nr:glycosyltransferase, DXD sugar-binding motif protein [Artemisia annua]
MFNTNTFVSNVSFNVTPKSSSAFPLTVFDNHTFIINQLKSTSVIHNPVLIVNKVIVQETVINNDHNSTNGSKKKLAMLDILHSNQDFETRAREFFKGCEVRFFMTWISSDPQRVFGEREMLAVDALFNSNPNGCLMILSNTMDSEHGFQVLKPVLDLGFKVQAIEPDFGFLFGDTPAKSWFDNIKEGNRDPGEIPLAQNLSNLLRLVVLYKYGGVYLDTDFILLKDFSGLCNAIGAQSATRSGNWTRLNNAVLIFDKEHPLLYKFIEEFALTFNGNKWGYNGPYLVSRVVERWPNSNISVLPPAVFYQVDWTRIGGLFRRPENQAHRKWVEAKVVQLKEKSHGIHLWNKQSRRLKIEDESIMARLVSDHCVVCTFFNRSRRLLESEFISS